MRGIAFMAGFLLLSTFQGVRGRTGGELVAQPLDAVITSRTGGRAISAGHLEDRGSAPMAASGADRTERRRTSMRAGGLIPSCAVPATSDKLPERREWCPEVAEHQLEEVTWALGRFHAAGLTPPRVRFVFHDDPRKCRLRRGLFNPNTRSIEICHLNRETLIHELAHAWIDANLSGEARAAFMRHRDLTVWNDHSVPWAERATEHAAEIVAWGVEEESRLVGWVEPGDHHTLRLLTIPDSTPEELAMSYRQLTGIPAHPDRSLPPPTLRPAFSPEAARLGSPTN